MPVNRLFVASGACLLTFAPAFAGNDVAPTGETHIISRDHNRIFQGSHQIYRRQSDGLVEVSYCGRSYWVRYATVAWTQLEVEKDHDVRVEYNKGKGWRSICNNPDEQVTLHKLGIYEDPRLVMHSDGGSTSRVNRFAAIREAFRPTTVEDAANSFRND